MNTPDALLKNTSALSESYQQKCLQQLPASSSSRDSIASLLCGEKITESPLKENLTKTSLIHIFVVSGSHLLLLDQFLGIIRLPLVLRILFLGFYSLVVGWQAPAVRALLALVSRWGLRHWRLHFPGDLLVLLCGMLALIIFPRWWTSMSFQMSWCAALALSVPGILRISSRSWRGALMSHALIFLLMIPALWGWGSLHPLGILSNLVLAPVVSLILLPLSFLALFHTVFLSLFTRTLGIFEFILRQVAEPITIPHLQAISSVRLWLWILFLHTALHFLRLRLHQGKDR